MCLNAGGMGRQDAESETLIPAISYQCQGGSVGKMGTLRTGDGVTSGVPFVLSVHGTQDPDTLAEQAHTPGCNQGQENATCTCKTANTKASGVNISYDSAAYTPDTSPNQAIVSSSAVRRFTPRECERLQGFPDDYTAIPWRGKPAESCPDGPRYRALGNSMAVPVMSWIGRRD